YSSDLVGTLNHTPDMANRPPRLRGFEYVGLHQYFLTICTRGRAPCFEDQHAAAWITEQITQCFDPMQFAVIAFCVMPDHVHLLLEGLQDDADLKIAMHDWKQTTSYAWKQRAGTRLWQEGYYDHVVREDDSVVGIVRYILNNPIKAG